MTAHAIAPVIASSERVSTESLRQLARIEAVRSLRRVSIWIGFVLTILIVSGPTTADWPGGSYTEKLPQSFMPIVFGAFIAAFRTGRRDSHHDVSESAPLGPHHRALARLGSLALPVFLTALIVLGFAVATRIEGGFWLGDHPRRTDTALHPLGELVQPILIVAFVGAAGIAIGRLREKAALSIAIVAGAVGFTMFPGYWLWNIPPVHSIALVQTQPMFIELDAATDLDQLPATWFVEVPDDGTAPTRQLVHQPTILGHTLYLIGLTALAVGLAVRRVRGRQLLSVGAALAVAGVVIQLLVNPA